VRHAPKELRDAFPPVLPPEHLADPPGSPATLKVPAPVSCTKSVPPNGTVA
jgi:hypothetical protein